MDCSLTSTLTTRRSTAFAAPEVLIGSSAAFHRPSVTSTSVWMRSNRLQLNAAKTEVLCCTSARRQEQLPTTPLQVGHDLVTPVKMVRDLGIYLDCDLSMRTHITKTVSACFAALRQIRSIRRSVSRSVLKSLIVALVLSRLDYGSTTLAGLPDT
jgi:hypothetical protein